MKFLSGFKTYCTTALMGLGALGMSWLSGCSTPATPKPQAMQRPEAMPTSRPPAHTEQRAPESVNTRSLARNAQDYRKDAASHLYAKHSHQIYKGRLPPMLEAVGVLNVDIDRQGGVKAIHWMRAPRHVPQVMKEIERLVKAAAPYPVPQHLSQVTYTDVWLWHKSGKFQLDTLTEGQD
jgi:periplasmic protein TonB